MRRITAWCDPCTILVHASAAHRVVADPDCVRRGDSPERSQGALDATFRERHARKALLEPNEPVARRATCQATPNSHGRNAAAVPVWVTTARTTAAYQSSRGEIAARGVDELLRSSTASGAERCRRVSNSAKNAISVAAITWTVTIVDGGGMDARAHRGRRSGFRRRAR